MKKPFKLKSGNSPLFKYMGSTPIRAAKVKAKTKTKKLGSDILTAVTDAYTKTPKILYKSGLEAGLDQIAGLEEKLDLSKYVEKFKKYFKTKGKKSNMTPYGPAVTKVPKPKDKEIKVHQRKKNPWEW